MNETKMGTELGSALSLKNMKVRTKLWILVGTTVGGLLIFTAMALSTVKSVAVNSDLYKRIALGNSVVSDYVPPSQSMLEPQGVILLMADDPGHADKYIQDLKTLRKQLEDGHADYMKTVPAGKLRDAMSGVAYTSAEQLFDMAEKEYIPLIVQGKIAEARELRSTRMAPIYDQHAAGVAEIVQLGNDQVSANEKDAASQVPARITAMILFGSFLAGLIAIIGFFVGKGILAPIRQAMNVLEKVADGDLTVSLDLQTQDEMGRMAAALNNAVGRLNSTMQEVADSAANATTSSQHLAAAAEAIASGAAEQAASLEETSASLEEITAAVQQSADNARQASQLAAGSKDSALQGQEVVSKAITAMAEINAASAKISDIISTIDEIAFQTNLLAVNAAVEAARAGDEGRGFAVVASEVRSLAQRSAVAAKEIKGLIQDSLRKVDAGSGLVNRSGETLQGIVSSVKRVTDIVGEMAASAGEQSSGIAQVNTAMTQMDQVTQSNSAQTEELSATAQSLYERSTHLMELIGNFTLGQSGTSVRDREASQHREGGLSHSVGASLVQSAKASHVHSALHPSPSGQSSKFTQRAGKAARSAAPANSNPGPGSGNGQNVRQTVLATAASNVSGGSDASFEEF